ncbi:MAG: hypothetical protein QOG76_5894, partial [Pseudonocardiales bacterium]|nr:hypothetical protein [Pseudonocardiales bacterium]
MGRRELAYLHQPGEPGRVPLVLCNGIGSSMELFDPLVRELDPGRPVVRFDVPGIGGSAQPKLPYTYHQLAFTMRGLLDRLGYARADVLGISWGGGLAQQFAFQHPWFCRRVVLLATATGMCMVPATPKVLARMLTPGGTGIRTTHAASPATSTAAARGPLRTPPSRCCTARCAPPRS